MLEDHNHEWLQGVLKGYERFLFLATQYRKSRDHLITVTYDKVYAT